MSRLLGLLSWLAFPIYAWQGISVRLKTERILPPPDPALGSFDGTGEPLRLLVIGDSSAASVGADSARDGLACHLAEIINNYSGRPVIWRAAGFNSATTGQIRDLAVPNLPADPWSFIVIAAGTNDVKNFHTLRRFKKDFGGLLYALRAKFPEAGILWSQIVDMRDVPALPRLLAHILEIRASLLNRLGVRLCRERFAEAAERLPITDPAGFASDGFHAGPRAYRAWAEHLAPLVISNLQSKDQIAPAAQ